jgi:hypothetical protein
MKSLKAISLMFLTVILFNLTSCLVLTPASNNGKHKGWYKNPNNPHHPNSTNPGTPNGKAQHPHKK